MEHLTTLLLHMQSHTLSYVTGFNTLLLLCCQYRLGSLSTGLLVSDEGLRVRTQSIGRQIHELYEHITRAMLSIPGTSPAPSSRKLKTRGSKKRWARKITCVCVMCDGKFKAAKANAKYCSDGCYNHHLRNRSAARKIKNAQAKGVRGVPEGLHSDG